jgi:hypothetical protein
MEKIPQPASVWGLLSPVPHQSINPSAICIACSPSISIVTISPTTIDQINPHLNFLHAIFIQQNETQRGFPLPHGDRFVGLGLSTLPCTLLCYECQYEPSNTAVVIVMPCR